MRRALRRSSYTPMKRQSWHSIRSPDRGGPALAEKFERATAPHDGQTLPLVLGRTYIFGFGFDNERPPVD